MGITTAVVGLRFLGFLQPWELNAYDHLMRLRPGPVVVDDRILIIGIEDEDIQYQYNQEMTLEGSLSDEALLNVLQRINNLAPYSPSIIGLDIIRTFPFSDELQSYLNKTDSLVGICRIGSKYIDDHQSSDIFPNSSYQYQHSSIKPPPSLSENDVGFSSHPSDPDGISRRQFLGRDNTDNICKFNESFSFLIAQKYLSKIENIQIERLAIRDNQKLKNIRLGQTIFKPLMRNSGGYQLPVGHDGGYQILINYGHFIPDVIPLREVISGAADAKIRNITKNQIILIGGMDKLVDSKLIPHSASNELMPGVMLQAHKINQIIDAALGDRPLLSWWEEDVEILWIFTWGLVGTGIVCLGRSPSYIVLGVITGSITLWSACFLLFLGSWWVPLVPALISLLGSSLTSCMMYLMWRQSIDPSF